MPTTTIITLVHTPACHFCTDAQETLTDLAQHHSIRVDLVAAESDAGQSLIRAHRPTMFPLVLVDDHFFSVGRLPRRKLQALLVAKPAEARS